MGAELSALRLVERLFEQRAEDCRIDLAPIVLGRRQQLADLLAAERRTRAVSSNRPPLKWRTRASMTWLNASPSSICCPQACQRCGEVRRVRRRSSQEGREAVAAATGPTSSANIVKRQRIRKCATSSASQPRSSSALQTSARRAGDVAGDAGRLPSSGRASAGRSRSTPAGRGSPACAGLRGRCGSPCGRGNGRRRGRCRKSPRRAPGNGRRRRR